MHIVQFKITSLAGIEPATACYLTNLGNRREGRAQSLYPLRHKPFSVCGILTVSRVTYAYFKKRTIPQVLTSPLDNVCLPMAFCRCLGNLTICSTP